MSPHVSGKSNLSAAGPLLCIMTTMAAIGLMAANGIEETQADRNGV